MNHDRVTAKFGVTMRLNPKRDDYEFLRADAELSTDVSPNETVEEAYSRAFETVKKQVREVVEKIYEE